MMNRGNEDLLPQTDFSDQECDCSPSDSYPIVPFNGFTSFAEVGFSYAYEAFSSSTLPPHGFPQSVSANSHDISSQGIISPPCILDSIDEQCADPFNTYYKSLDPQITQIDFSNILGSNMGSSFGFQEGPDQHLTITHHNDPIHGEIHQTGGNQIRRQSSSKKPFDCFVCRKSFATITQLNRHKKCKAHHQKQSSPKKPFECFSCYTSFAKMSQLNVHKRTMAHHKKFEDQGIPCFEPPPHHLRG